MSDWFSASECTRISRTDARQSGPPSFTLPTGPHDSVRVSRCVQDDLEGRWGSVAGRMVGVLYEIRADGRAATLIGRGGRGVTAASVLLVVEVDPQRVAVWSSPYHPWQESALREAAELCTNQ